MKDETFEKMRKIAGKKIRHYMSDFTVHDTKAYKQMKDGNKFIWIVRDCGSWIVRIPSTIEFISETRNFDDFAIQIERNEFKNYLNEVRKTSLTICNHYDDDKNDFYLVSKGMKIEKISKSKALEILEK